MLFDKTCKHFEAVGQDYSIREIWEVAPFFHNVSDFTTVVPTWYFLVMLQQTRKYFIVLPHYIENIIVWSYRQYCCLKAGIDPVRFWASNFLFTLTTALNHQFSNCPQKWLFHVTIFLRNYSLQMQIWYDSSSQNMLFYCISTYEQIAISAIKAYALGSLCRL